MDNLRVLEIAVQTGIPTIVWGRPGVGKTFYFNDLIKSLGWHMETLVASTREPVDFSGLPVRIGDNGSTEIRLAPIGLWVKNIMEACAKKQRCVVFLDEFTTAPPATQAATLKMIHEGLMGETKFDLNLVSFLAAANPADCAANGWELSPPMANRFFHFHWKVDTQAWIMGMLAGWPQKKITPLDQNWRSHIPSARSKVAAFINVRPQQLHNMPESESERGKAWPSPRTWDMFATLRAAALSENGSKDIVIGLAAGCLGESLAIEYASWEDALDLPDPEELLKNPEKTKIPKRGDQIFAMLGAVVSAVLSNNTKERWCSAWDVLAVVNNAGAPDIAATAANSLAMNMPVGVKPPPSCAVFGSILRSVGKIG